MGDNDTRDRTHLPIPDPRWVGVTTYDAKDPETRFPPIAQIRPPAKAPNVLVILIDDAGFGSSSVFGGPCNTPTLERLAGEGLRYTRFHTTALCSPTRAALLNGRNHHSVGMGGITEIATSAPGYNSVRPKDKAPVAEVLKLNGYSTAQFGKCHEVPVWETSPMGPFDSWPTGSGFEHFYGFIGGETNQYAPAIYQDTVPIEPDKTAEEGYHFTEDMTDRAIDWIRQQKALMPDKPFFAYFAPGATHAPHHVRPEWSDKYKGMFDDGWDEQRKRTFARQKELGVIPPDAELTERAPEIPGWEDMPADLRPVLARQMEVYAGFLEHTDHHVGRLVDSLKDLEILDDTLIFYIVGDNGASAEGTPNGCFNELVTLNGAFGVETTEFMVSKIAEFGTPTAYNHYAVGWAHAMDTPYQWTKQIASHWGGTRNGMVVHWPNGIKAKGEVRNQFHHVIDVAPTILEAAGLPAPTFVNGIQQAPIEGVSMGYSFDDGKADDRHTTQYFEMFVNRGIYHEGWTAVTQAFDPMGCHEGPGPRRRRLGAVRPRRLDAVTEHRHPAAREARAAPTPVPDRGDEIQRPAARRSAIRAIQLGPGRPSATDPWQHPGAVRWDGQAIRELGRRHQEQVPRHHGRGRRPRTRWPGMRHRARGRVRGLDALHARGAPGLLLQPVRDPALQGLRRRGRAIRRTPAARRIRV